MKKFTSRILESGKELLTKSLKSLFNNMIRHQKMPEGSICSKVILRIEKGNPDDIRSYHPISLLPIMSSVSRMFYAKDFSNKSKRGKT